MSNSENRYLCFRLDQEKYAAPLLDVKEVLGIPEITPIPQVPNYFLGIMNLRGKVISVVDLRLKFGLKTAKGDETCIVIFEYGELSIGVVVDEVESVLSVEPGQLAAPPDVQQARRAKFVTGIINHADSMILVIDIVQSLEIKEDVLKRASSPQAA